MYTYSEKRDMKVHVFKMDDGAEYHVLARTFAEACQRFDQFGLDGRDVQEMREYTPQVLEAE